MVPQVGAKQPVDDSPSETAESDTDSSATACSIADYKCKSKLPVAKPTHRPKPVAKPKPKIKPKLKPKSKGIVASKSGLPFSIGCRVKAARLTLASEYNDQQGICEVFDKASLRWQVRFDSGITKNMKLANLELVAEAGAGEAGDRRGPSAEHGERFVADTSHRDQHWC